MGRYRRARLLQYRNRRASLHGGEIGEKLVQRIASFKIVEQVLYGHAGASKHRHASLNLRINGNYMRFHIEASTFNTDIIRPYEDRDG
jgi:hypothetical protein